MPVWLRIAEGNCSMKEYLIFLDHLSLEERDLLQFMSQERRASNEHTFSYH